jgi:chromosome partitioning protein
MLVQTSQGQSGSAHVVVLGNEKGGSGKSTAALHVAVALLKAGQRVATIDLDCRQQSFTRYINNRSAWAHRPRPRAPGSPLHQAWRDYPDFG